MKVDPYIRTTKLLFSQLLPGETYRTENGEAIYMKIRAASVNAVSLQSGSTFKHKDTYRVFRVDGVFKETHSA